MHTRKKTIKINDVVMMMFWNFLVPIDDPLYL